MKIDLKNLCEKVEIAVPMARATPVPELNQVIVSFTERPDVQVALLTPWLQSRLASGTLVSSDLDDTIHSLVCIANTHDAP